MPLTRADTVVVGGGVIGAAVFHALAEGGTDVVLTERHRAGMGSTGWSGAVVRCYHDNPVLVGRAIEGWRIFRDFAAHTGETVPFTRCGWLCFPPEDQLDHARAETKRLNDRGVPAEWLEPADLEDHFGHLIRERTGGAVWEPEAGYLDPRAVTNAYLAAGQRAGGRVAEAVAARVLLRRGRGACGVQTSAGPIWADTVVLATGAATPALLTSWGIEHDLWAQAVQVDLRIPQDPGPAAQHPAFTNDVFQIYGRPHPASGGVLVGFPTGTRLGPPSVAEPADLAQTQLAGQAAARRLSWVAGSEVLGGRRAAECYAPDDLGRVRRLTDDGSLLMATGFNGGGFKMAPWAAQEVARLLEGRGARTP